MRFEVPQFIEVEDKIFGPFTWKQFIYLAGGAGAAVTLYLMLPFFLFVSPGQQSAFFRLSRISRALPNNQKTLSLEKTENTGNTRYLA